jgi:uncharacterized protein YegJ (DUF2314 family)
MPDGHGYAQGTRNSGGVPQIGACASANDEDEIVDWLYQDGSTMRGNFTACVLLRREPRAEAENFMKQIGLRCDP